MQIYIAKSGQQTGPFTAEQLLSMLDSGMITLNDSAWHDRLTSWQPLHQVVSITPPATIPPPPYSISQAMYCQKCGSEVVGVAKFCRSCGNIVTESKTPIGLIIATWTFFVFSIVPFLAIPASMVMLVTSIMLVRSGNRTGKVNGIIALIIWGITFMIGFAVGFASTYGK